MSSRALRKATGGAPVGKENDKEDEEEEEELKEEEEEEPLQAKKNVFGLLDLEDFGENEDEEDPEEKNGVLCQAKNTGDGLPKGKKKKKKQKKQKKQEEEFDLDRYAQQVAEERKRCAVMTDDLPTGATGPGHDRSVLAIDYRSLDPDFEMSRIFGAGVMRQEGVRRLSVRSRGTALIRPKANWPAAAQVGLSMRHCETTADGELWFAIEHNKEYRKLQEQFYLAVQSYNPDNLQEIMRRQPYHIDTLLQLSEVFKMQEDYDVAADLIERALYAFTRSSHSMFNVANGHCRLDYRIDVNRALFLVIFHHINFLSRRGCCRTALEFCKVLLSLNPKDDPLAAILMVDHYCIMTSEFDFLLRFYDLWQAFKNLNQLPNFAFSCALAKWRRSKSNEETAADLMLQDALLRFPGWLPLLLDKCSVAPDARVANSDFFNKDPHCSVGLQQLYKLHVGRSHHSWKEPLAMRWLERNVTAVLDLVKLGRDPRIAEYKNHRKRRYKKTPINVLRHILLAAVPGVPVDLSSHSSQGEITLYDPLPPSDNIVSYRRPALPRRVELESGVFTSLLRSFLPNYDPSAPPPGGPPAANNLEALMEGIRELLAGLQPAPPPVQNRQREQGEEEEEEVVVEEVD